MSEEAGPSSWGQSKSNLVHSRVLVEPASSSTSVASAPANRFRIAASAIVASSFGRGVRPLGGSSNCRGDGANGSQTGGNDTVARRLLTARCCEEPPALPVGLLSWTAARCSCEGRLLLEARGCVASPSSGCRLTVLRSSINLFAKLSSFSFCCPLTAGAGGGRLGNDAIDEDRDVNVDEATEPVS